MLACGSDLQIIYSTVSIDNQESDVLVCFDTVQHLCGAHAPDSWYRKIFL